MSVFAYVVPGRLVAQTEQVPGSPERFAASIPDASSLNHICVFLTGAAPLPNGYACTVHLELPGKGWQLIGSLSMQKPSAIFRLRGSFIPSNNAGGFSNMAGTSGSTNATLGILCEPVANVEAQIASLKPGTDSTTSTELVLAKPTAPTDSIALAQAVGKNLFNAVSGFTRPLPDGSGTWVDFATIERWYRTDERSHEIALTSQNCLSTRKECFWTELLGCVVPWASHRLMSNSSSRSAGQQAGSTAFNHNAFEFIRWRQLYGRSHGRGEKRKDFNNAGKAHRYHITDFVAWREHAFSVGKGMLFLSFMAPSSKPPTKVYATHHQSSSSPSVPRPPLSLVPDQSSLSAPAKAVTRSIRVEGFPAPVSFRSAAPEEELEYRQCAIPLFAPCIAVLKSKAALSTAMTISRFALTVLPLSIRAKVLHAIRMRAARPEASDWIRRLASFVGDKPASLAMRLNASIIFPLLVIAPFLLVAASVVGSIERVPVTGRFRIVQLSVEEEQSLVDAVLHAGQTGAEFDWITVMNKVMGIKDEGVSQDGRRLFMGAPALDDNDWRVRWTRAVLLRLIDPDSTQRRAVQNGDVLSPPPSPYPLHPSDSSTDFDLILLDGPERTAFGFGFGPREATDFQRKGVIVVYTGYLNDILGYDTSARASDNDTSRQPGLLSNVLPSKRSSTQISPPQLPSVEQCQELAVLLSHELSHLLLSHVLESYASTDLLIPHLSRMLSDVARTIAYPFTALLGPFVNDAIGKSLEVGSTDGFSMLGKFSMTQSLKREAEADIVGLRLLANAGIDPRCALKFWERRLKSHDQETATAPFFQNMHQSKQQQPGCQLTHPENAKRLEKIKRELDSWIAYHSIHQDNNKAAAHSLAHA